MSKHRAQSVIVTNVEENTISFFLFLKKIVLMLSLAFQRLFLVVMVSMQLHITYAHPTPSVNRHRYKY